MKKRLTHRQRVNLALNSGIPPEKPIVARHAASTYSIGPQWVAVWAGPRGQLRSSRSYSHGSVCRLAHTVAALPERHR